MSDSLSRLRQWLRAQAPQRIDELAAESHAPAIRAEIEREHHRRRIIERNGCGAEVRVYGGWQPTPVPRVQTPLARLRAAEDRAQPDWSPVAPLRPHPGITGPPMLNRPTLRGWARRFTISRARALIVIMRRL